MGVAQRPDKPAERLRHTLKTKWEPPRLSEREQILSGPSCLVPDGGQARDGAAEQDGVHHLRLDEAREDVRGPASGRRVRSKNETAGRIRRRGWAEAETGGSSKTPAVRQTRHCRYAVAPSPREIPRHTLAILLAYSKQQVSDFRMPCHSSGQRKRGSLCSTVRNRSSAGPSLHRSCSRYSSPGKAKCRVSPAW